MMKRVAASVGILVLAGSGGLAHAAGAAARPFPAPGVPKEIASKRVIGGRPLVLGDLKPASDFDADALLGHASNDSKTLARCVEIAQGGIPWSDANASLDFTPLLGYAATTKIATAYCDNGVVFLGGSRQEVEDGEPRTWLFYWSRVPGQEFGPVSILARKSYGYTLTELKAIDPVSRRLLFSGTSPDGKDLLLAAQYAFVSRR